MDEYVIKQKIQKACFEPRAPEELIQKVILRAQAVTMGAQAQKQLETAPVEKHAELAAHVLVGQLATVSELPKGARPEQLAQQLAQKAEFLAALRGGNLAGRLHSGELLQQLTGKKPAIPQASPEKAAPKKEGPVMG